MAHRFHVIVPSKAPSATRTTWIFWAEISINWCSLFFKLNFLLKREEIKHFCSKISSYSLFPCILDSIAIRLRQDQSRIIMRNGWIRPLNAERTSKKKPDKCAAIKAIWSKIDNMLIRHDNTWLLLRSRRGFISAVDRRSNSHDLTVTIGIWCASSEPLIVD